MFSLVYMYVRVALMTVSACSKSQNVMLQAHVGAPDPLEGVEETGAEGTGAGAGGGDAADWDSDESVEME